MTLMSETQRRRLNAPFIASLVAVVFIALAVIAPHVLAPGSPTAINPSDAFSPPSLAHLFGTDESGRDVFTRVIHGASASAGIGIAATALGLGAGVVLGVIAGVGPRFVDTAISRLVEVLFALPSLVLALLFIAVLGPGPTSSIIAIGLATTPGYARIVRSRVRQIVRSGYVEQARADGVRPLIAVIRHVLPNALWPLIGIATLGIGQAIVWVAALGFLGLGQAPPSPEWGALLNAGRVYIGTAWWLTVAPGLAIVATAAVLTVVGRQVGQVRK